MEGNQDTKSEHYVASRFLLVLLVKQWNMVKYFFCHNAITNLPLKSQSKYHPGTEIDPMLGGKPNTL